jgi:iduronate 2-sulfatase
MNRRQFIRKAALASGVAVGGSMYRKVRAEGTASRDDKDHTLGRRPNVLFILVDDLRPELGCYGHPIVQSPHIDSLADEGVIFERAYCQQAICNPSRSSLLSGVRPDTSGIYENQTLLRDVLPDIVTLPQHFRQNGYRTVGLSKVFHHAREDPEAWTSDIRPGGAWSLWDRQYTEWPDVEDNVYRDGQTTEAALRHIRTDSEEPWFVAVGYIRPHSPLAAPLRYWQQYDRSALEPPNQAKPAAVPDCAWQREKNIYQYLDTPDEAPLDDETACRVRHGYYACVSFIDQQIGHLLAELERTGQRENTVVILVGDNGIKLGEYGSWAKHTLFEYDTRVPLIISAPGLQHNRRNFGIVELLDLYPTLTDLCGLDTPDTCEGRSLVPLLKDPSQYWPHAAFSQQPRKEYNVMGYSVRADRWRYNEWFDLDSGERVARELYDHAEGPHAYANLADKAEWAPVVSILSAVLQSGDASDILPKIYLPSLARTVQ